MSNTKKALAYGFLGLAAIAYFVAGFVVANQTSDFESKSTVSLFVSIISIAVAVGLAASIKGSSLSTADYLSLIVVGLTIALMLLASHYDWGLLPKGLVMAIALITGYQLVV